jgi:putative transposase
MSKGKHSEAQIIGVVKQAEAGRKVEDLARERGVSEHTIYAWKSKYGGMDVSEAQEVKQRSGQLQPIRVRWRRPDQSG